MMMQEHESANHMVAELRRLTMGLSRLRGRVPRTLRSFRLRAFELDLEQHVHLENDVLFPRAIEMEAELNSRGVNMATDSPMDATLSEGGDENDGGQIVARERQKSLMLRAWILSGLFFMALPGTLLGFSNLMAISTHHGLGALPAAWIRVTATRRSSAGLAASFSESASIRSHRAAGRSSDPAGMLCPLEFRRCDALGCKHLRMALARSASDLRWT